MALGPVQTLQSDALDPDADLIANYHLGDETVLSQLMDRHMNTLYKLCYYMLGDAMAAEDVTQTVFLKTWQALPKWKAGQAKLITWMRRVATNRCLDILKKKKPIYSDAVPELSDSADTPFEALARIQQGERVKAAIMKLPDRQRAALTLSYYQNVSQKDGAAVLNISQSAYESLLVRARKALKQNLAGQSVDPRNVTNL